LALRHSECAAITGILGLHQLDYRGDSGSAGDGSHADALTGHQV
jgi:hypothetical protein